jgi:formylglycine-generating enzyme required for sulfatase activity
VVLCSVALTTLIIDASDSLQGSGGSMLARVINSDIPVCPLGMTHYPAALTFTCVDTYEAAPGSDCSIENPSNQFQTEANISQKNCVPASNPNLLPWRYVSREQARTLCTKAGKRLPSASEWYEFALGTNKDTCVIDGTEPVSGMRQAECISALGVVGAVGNVWEWVNDDVKDGVVDGRLLPLSGRIVSVDSDGLPNQTAEVGDDFLPGYFWSDPFGDYGIIRGGFYGSKRDAGLYTTHAHTESNFVGAAVGFRCVR